MSEGFEIIANGTEVIVDVPGKYKFTSSKGLNVKVYIGSESTGSVVEQKEVYRKK
jgi:hypothetical protein